KSLDAKDSNFRKYARKGVPKLILGWIDGPTYLKGGPGKIYNPTTDKIVTAGCGPKAVVLNLFYSAMLGAAGVNEYGFDTLSREKTRDTRPVSSTSNVSTGAN